MNIKAIITDYGGVLVKMIDEKPRQQLVERTGVPLKEIYRLIFNTEASIQATLGEITCDQLWETVRAALNLPEANLPDFIAQFWSADGLNQGMITYLRSLRSRYKVGLLSNAADDLRLMLIERWQIADLFDDMVISAEVHLAKPDKRIYELACARLGVLPSEAVFIDDILANVEGARRAGLHGVQYHNDEQAIAEVNRILSQG